MDNKRKFYLYDWDGTIAEPFTAMVSNDDDLFEFTLNNQEYKIDKELLINILNDPYSYIVTMRPEDTAAAIRLRLYNDFKNDIEKEIDLYKLLYRDKVVSVFPTETYYSEIYKDLNSYLFLNEFEHLSNFKKIMWKVKTMNIFTSMEDIEYIDYDRCDMKRTPVIYLGDKIRVKNSGNKVSIDFIMESYDDYNVEFETLDELDKFLDILKEIYAKKDEREELVRERKEINCDYVFDGIGIYCPVDLSDKGILTHEIAFKVLIECYNEECKEMYKKVHKELKEKEIDVSDIDLNKETSTFPMFFFLTMDELSDLIKALEFCRWED